LNKEGKTVVMVTHDVSVAEYAHRVIYLRDGIVYFGDYNKKVIEK